MTLLLKNKRDPIPKLIDDKKKDFKKNYVLQIETK